ncbi:tight junction protein ZO-1-like isoform X3 [Clavelina lepadiformis]|uniref:tight junction protein ZO-1-like isoform X3 n=1 Tax=Clavelina lepadiformis TaxID=159417 RepID=UPI0040433BAB
MDEVIFQEHAYVLEKAPGVGFGIAISGGRDNPGAQTGDTSIIISDVVRGGPAFERLKVNDIVMRVNGKPMFNMEHSRAVKELKNAGHRVELLIKRRVVVRVETTPPPGRLRRSRSRDLDSLPSHRRSRSRSRDPDRGRYRSQSRDLDDYHRRHRSKSRDLDSARHRRRSRHYSRSRSRTPPRRRSRSYSRSPSRGSRRRGRSYSRSPSPRSSRRRSPSPESNRSYRRDRSRSRSPPRRSRSRSLTPSSRSATPPRRNSPPPMDKHKSIDDLRRTLSPLSPDPAGASSSDDMLVFPVKTRDPQTVVLKKTRWNNSYGLKLGTRIFIQDIQPGSLADKSSEISAGDTILMINGRNVDNKTVQEAIQVIGLSKDKVTMVVKKEDGGTVSLPAEAFRSPAPTEPAKKESESESEDDSRHSRRSSLSKHSEKAAKPVSETPKVAPKPDKKQQFGGIRVLPTGAAAPTDVDAASSSSSERSTPEPAPRTKHDVDREYAVPPGPSDDDEPVLPPTARQITFVKGKNVGIRLAGGNDVGIFVASVQEGSPAAKQGLKMGDQILSVNQVNFRNIIREEAVLTLMGLPAGEEVRIIAQPRPNEYKKILEHGTGDSFYIRTHFKYEKSGQHEMSFKRGSAFRISDTLYQGMVGYWLAVRIGRNNMEIERGVIPNSSRAEQLKMVQDKKIAQMRERSNRGIAKRVLKNQKSSANATASASAMFPAYERVVLREAGFKRPTVIFGPLADIARERLAGDYPTFYEVARNEGALSGQKSNRKGVIRLNTIKDIIEKDKHAILDITPTAVEKLNYAQLYPIVVFLESSSKAAVKDMRQKLAATDVEKKKKSGKLYDRAHKLQRGYNHVFTDTIKLTAANDDWYRKLHSTIKDQQSMPVWVSEDKLGGSGEEMEEGVTVPGDDDQFSYVSAPASDYSVTTVGSDMLNSSRMSDEEEQDLRPVDIQRPQRRVSSSSSEDEDGGKFGDDDFDDGSVEDEPPANKPVPPHNIDPEPMSAAPPRDKKIHPKPPVNQPPPSSSSSEEEAPPPVVVHKPTPTRVSNRTDAPRGGQEIPAGRFDPKSFLKNHIRGLKSVSKDEDDAPYNDEPVEERAPEPVRTAPTYNQPAEPVRTAPTYNQPAEPVRTAPTYNQPPAEPSSLKPTSLEPIREQDNILSYTTAKPFVRQPISKPQPQQPVYAQVQKKRPTQPAQPPQDRRESSGRDYAGEIDNFISNDPYRRPAARPVENRPPPVRSEPAQPRYDAGSYNRFAGSQAKTEPKPYQPYTSAKPQGYQRPPVTNGMPQKSNFPQDRYKDFMNQTKPSSSNPRPYKPPGAAPFQNGPSKEQMYDSGVDTYDNAKPKKEPVPVSPSTIDEDDPQVVATARGVFDSNGGVLSSVETGVSIHIPKGAIRPGVKQEIYFKVCRDNTALPPLDKDKGETLLSPLVMCGPHGLQFDHPVELRLPHCASMTSDGWSFALKTSNPGEPSQWHNVNVPNESNNYDVGSNSVSVLIDHF